MFEDKSTEIVSFLENNGVHVAITPQQVVFQKGRKVTFDVEHQELSILKNVPWKVKNTYPFSLLRNFELITTEQFADATPFSDGNKEYIHTVRLNFKSGKIVKLFSFVDRDPDGSDKLSTLMDLLRRVIT